MKHKIVAIMLLVLTLLPSNLSAGPLERMVERLIPQARQQILFVQEISPSKRNYFEISESSGKIRIRGNSPVNMACGLNWYLKHYGQPVITWKGKQIQLTGKLPMPQNLIRKETPLPHSFYLDQRAFGYTTAFWDWTDWEAEIDRMALNGITMPLALVGTECVWINTLKHFNYTEEEARATLAAPPFTSWTWSGHISQLGGTMPKEWTERQKRLQRRIVRQMRAYGMTPVFQVFTGIVPASLKEKYPNAKICLQKDSESKTRPAILDSTDPLFKEMAQVWYKEYEKLYGKTCYFYGDFIRPESLNPAETAENIQKALMEYDQLNVWIFQAKTDYPQLETLAGLKKQNTLIIDPNADCAAEWEKTHSFNNFPWLWAHTTNWNGNTGLYGQLDAIATETIRARQEAASSSHIKGIGAVPSGLGSNSVAFDLAWEMRWHEESPNISKWLNDYISYRYGKNDERLQKAWSLFYQTVYSRQNGTCRPPQSYICARPGLDTDRVTPNGSTQINYDMEKFEEGVRLFASARDSLQGCNAYEHDLTDLVRQMMSNKANTLYARIRNSFDNGDKDSLQLRTNQFLELLLLQDKLLSCRKEFCLSEWIGKARNSVKDPEAKEQMERNARMILTTWDNQNSECNDLGHREWSGLIRDYYYPRWQLFFNWLNRRAAGQHIGAPNFSSLEKGWTESHEQSLIPEANLYEMVDTCLHFTLL